jgi:2-keto-3-deoxy-L-rhamnonate aldolase RhmA
MEMTYCAMANAGYDYIWTEMQHNDRDWNQAARMWRTCPHAKAVPGARIAYADEREIQRATDAGALVIVVPTVDTVQEALAARDWTYFPPLGKRSQGGGQGFDAAMWGNVPGGYRSTINDNIVLILMIETLEGVKNAHETAKIPGVDALFAASGDLGNFSGYAQGTPDYERLINIVHDAAVVLLDGDGLREIRLARLFDRLRERRGGLFPRLCLVTDFVGYEALIGSLLRNDFFHFPRALVDVEYQGVHQSVTVRTRQPHHWIRKDNSGRRHLHAPGGLDAVLTPVYSGTFSRWFLEGTDHACVTTLADWQDPDQDFVSAGLALARGAELLVSLVPRRAGAPGASPFEKDGRVVLMEDGEVDPGLDRRLAHGRADVLSLKALFARMGLPWDQAEREEKARAFVSGLRGPPEVVRRAVEEAAVIRQVRTGVDQFIWPYSRLTSGLNTCYWVAAGPRRSGGTIRAKGFMRLGLRLFGGRSATYG